MQKLLKNIVFVIIIMLVTISLTSYAAFRATANNITLDSDKTEKENVKESLDELYEMSGGSGCEDGQICLGSLETTNSTKKCRRAKSLHTEICAQTDTGNYCSSTYATQNGTDIKNKDTIIYGNITITKGNLNSDDAFTCDVNGDGMYDEETERFYYVSNLYTGGAPGSETFDDNYAVLIYYNNTTAGVPDNTANSKVAYNSTNSIYLGPASAATNLPTTTQWSNVNLKSEERQIYNDIGTTTTGGGANTIAVFSYTDLAARLITYQEVRQACGTEITSNGIIDTPTCRFLLENTRYSITAGRMLGYWLETPNNSNNTIYMLFSTARNLGTGFGNGANVYATRPAIEVLKTDIAY